MSTKLVDSTFENKGNEKNHVFDKNAKFTRILTLTDDNQIVTNEESLKKILLHPEIKDRKIVTISVVGIARKGKSFLLNYCLRYLYAHYPSINHPDNSTAHPNDWMGNEDEPLTGFSWRAGSARDTSGIVMWNDAFLSTNKNGNKIAIILIDTQGLQDRSADFQVFSFAALISSILVFNIYDEVEDNQLKYLESAVKLGKNGALNKNLFQKLIFLIRDWTNIDEYPFDSDGCKNYLKSFLTSDIHNSKDYKNTHRSIRDSFEDISCFLLPHPGSTVVVGKKLNKDYDGNSRDMDEDFRDELKIFIEDFLNLKNVSAKKSLKGLEYLEYIQHVSKLIKEKQSELINHENSVEKENSLKEDQFESLDPLENFKDLDELVEDCVKIYQEGMKKKSNELTDKDVTIYHKMCESSALLHFENEKPESASDTKPYRKELEKKIQYYFDRQNIDPEKEIVKKVNEIAIDVVEQLKDLKDKMNEYSCDEPTSTDSKLKSPVTIQNLKNSVFADIEKIIKENAGDEVNKNDKNKVSTVNSSCIKILVVALLILVLLAVITFAIIIIVTNLTNVTKVDPSKINCHYHEGSSITFAISTGYACELGIQNISEYNHEYLNVEIIGTHLPQKNDTDVKLLKSQTDLKMKNFPSVICQKFINLEEITLTSTIIENLDENSLKSCENLKVLQLFGNQLLTLPEDLLSNNKKLTDISISGNMIQTLPEKIFEAQIDLEYLDLDSNNITNLPENIFRSQTELKFLNLTNNHIEKLSPSCFEKLEKLKDLQLGGNKITNLTENVFGSQTELKFLNLTNNHIDTLSPSCFEKLEKLEDLQLDGNKITNLPENIFRSQTKLKILNLENNQIETLGPKWFEKLEKLKDLQLGGNKITNLTENMFGFQTELKILNLTNNHIDTLSPSCFEKLEKLEDLQLDGNKITNLPENIFRSQTKLKILNLENNQIETLGPKWFEKLEKLKDLQLGGNKITNLTDNMFGFQTELKILNLENNHIETLSPSCFEKLEKLEDLQLDGNKITNLPENIFRSQTKLKILNLTNNHIDTLSPSCFEKLEKLEDLQLDGNKITNLTDNMFEFQTELKILNLENNHIETLSPSCFEKLEKLEDLQLDGNKITNLPENIFRSQTKLKILNLTNNHIEKLSPSCFENLEKLEDLQLGGNKITNLTDNMFGFQTELKFLNLENNQIETLSPSCFEKLEKLEELLLNGNKITNLTETIFGFQTELKILNLENNQIETLSPKWFEKLVKLEDLVLSSNLISDLPKDVFKNLTSLKKLYLESNNITVIHADSFNYIATYEDLNFLKNYISSIDDKFIDDIDESKFRIDENICREGNEEYLKCFNTYKPRIHKEESNENVSTNPVTIPTNTINEITEECGKLKTEGDDIDGLMFPWNAKIIRKNRKYVCGGTLISTHKVVTAAHCIHIKGRTAQKFSEDDLQVQLGASLSNGNKIITKEVRKIYLNPGWNEKAPKYDADIAVLILKHKVTNRIQPLCLNNTDQFNATTFSGIVVGYGQSGGPKNFNISIRNDACSHQENNRIANISNSRTFCGSQGQGLGAEVCNLDSGSGVYEKIKDVFYLRGIVSAIIFNQSSNCGVDFYALFTDATYFSKWVKEIDVNVT